MGKIAARIVDAATGEAVEARVQVLTSGGVFAHPSDALLKVGTGLPFFYCDGEFSVDVPRGLTQVLVERGTEYVPARLDPGGAGARHGGRSTCRWSAGRTWAQRGWHPGNTHIHYDHNERRPDERLRLDPRVEDLRLTAISVLSAVGLALRQQQVPAGHAHRVHAAPTTTSSAARRPVTTTATIRSTTATATSCCCA